MPTVSVILTSYNHEKYLRNSIDSVLAQTYKDFELVIVDDCSTDRSWDIIESYPDERIVRVRHQENILFYANQTIQNLTQGKYIAIQHSDDIWEPHKLERQVAFLEQHPEYGATFSWAHAIDEQGEPFADESHFYNHLFDQPNRTRHQWLNYFFYQGNALCHPSVLIRRQCYEDCGYYRYGLAQLADFDMWIRLCLKYEIHVMPERLVRFRIRHNEANSSAYRRDTGVRSVTEYFLLWKSFLAIGSFRELASVFPAASQYDRGEDCSVEYVFSQICMEPGTADWARAFGVQLLFDLMQDAATREKLKQAYGFSLRDFLRVTGEQEMLLSETVKDRDRQLMQLDGIRMEHEVLIKELTSIRQEQERQLACRYQMARAQEAQIHGLQAELGRIYASRGWKALLQYYRFRDLLLPPNSRRRRLIKILARAAVDPGWFISRLSGARIRRFFINDLPYAAATSASYIEWLEREAAQKPPAQLVFKHIERFACKPLVTILLLVHSPDLIGLKNSVESVVRQLYSNWELCIVVVAPLDPQSSLYLAEAAEREPRIKLAQNLDMGLALDKATGGYIGFLAQSDELSELALYEVAKLLNEHPEADMVYSDEDRFDEHGHRTDPSFKPDWSPELLLGQLYTGGLGVYRTDIVREISGSCGDFSGCWLHDFVLRFTERTDRIFHLPKVLYHQRTPAGTPESFAAGKSAVEAALLRRGMIGDVEAVEGATGCYRIHYSLTSFPLVSIIIPTRDMADLLSECIRSILAKTQYPNYEIVIVDNGSVEESTRLLFAELQTGNPGKIRVVSLPAPFNYSQLNNFGAEQAKGELFLFLNNDIEVISGDWLLELAGFALQAPVGAVGANLLYPDYTVQHAGVVLGMGGIAGHGHKLLADSDPGYQQRLLVAANCSAVTGACLMIRRDVFVAVGGFDENLAVAFNDIDFCLRVHQQGWRNVVLNYVRLIHHESKSRGEENNKEKQRRFMQEIKFMETRWGNLLLNDPYYNPNLSLAPHGYSLGLPRQ